MVNFFLKPRAALLKENNKNQEFTIRDNTSEV